MNRKTSLELILFSCILAISLSACSCKHEYDSGTITKAATCTEEGIKSYKCTLCGKERKESIPCIAHEYDDGIVKKEATCTEEGIKICTCVLCGDEKEVSIPCTEHEYEGTVEKEATFDSTGEMSFACSICGDTYSEEIPVKERTVVVTVTDKRNTPKDTDQWRFSDRVDFTFVVENYMQKDIKGVSGKVTISDLFGKEIMTLGCDFTGQVIAAEGTATYSDLGIDINEFIDSDTKLYNEDFSDLKFEYVISSIVYTDGTSESF